MMNTNGMSHIGTFTPDSLIAGNRHLVDVCHVVIKAGQQLERGVVLEEDAEEAGKYVIRGTQIAGAGITGNAGDSDGSEDTSASAEEATKEVEAEYILAEAVDASEKDMTGTVYRSGEFAENALIVKAGYTLTDADRKALRKAGIFLKTIMM